MIITNERNEGRIPQAVAVAISDAVKGQPTLWLVQEAWMAKRICMLIACTAPKYYVDQRLIEVRVLG